MSDSKIHIRINASDATAKPAECGATMQATVTEAWGFYGPGGEGFDHVCKACIEARRCRLRRR